MDIYCCIQISEDVAALYIYREISMITTKEGEQKIAILRTCGSVDVTVEVNMQNSYFAYSRRIFLEKQKKP